MSIPAFLTVCSIVSGPAPPRCEACDRLRREVDDLRRQLDEARREAGAAVAVGYVNERIEGLEAEVRELRSKHK